MKFAACMERLATNAVNKWHVCFAQLGGPQLRGIWTCVLLHKIVAPAPVNLNSDMTSPWYWSSDVVSNGTAIFALYIKHPRLWMTEITQDIVCKTPLSASMSSMSNLLQYFLVIPCDDALVIWLSPSLRIEGALTENHRPKLPTRLGRACLLFAAALANENQGPFLQSLTFMPKIGIATRYNSKHSKACPYYCLDLTV